MRSTVGLAALALAGAFQAVAAKKCVHRPSSATGNTPSNASTDTPSVSSTATPSTSAGNSGSTTPSSLSFETPSSSSSIIVEMSSASNTPSTGSGTGTPVETTPSSSSAATPSESSTNTGIVTSTTPAVTPTSASGSTGTPTTPLTTASDAVVTNAVQNGNLARNTDGFTTDGDVSHDSTDGYTGESTSETGCAKLKVTGSGTSSQAPSRRNFKRQAAASNLVSISQGLTGLNVNTDYTLRFYYSIVTGSTTQNDCRLLAFFDDQALWSEFIMEPATSPTAYIQVTKQGRPSQANPVLRFSLRCDIGGSASVLIDSIFLSNQVTPATIDQYIIDYGSGSGSVPASSFTASTTTSSLAPLRTQECVQLGTAGNGLSASEQASYVRPRSQYDSPWPTPVTFRSCIEHCKNAYQYCGAASWNTNTKECVLYKGSLVQIGFASDTTSPINFYDGGCLRAPDKYADCGLMGSAVSDSTNPAYIRSSGPVPQAAACYQTCVGINMGCVSFSWDALSGICYMFRATRELSGFTPAARSSTTFYNRDCIAS
ncbi:unnamed protein product [Clonostachys rhizophaga]|uniref:Apple domain-containing protein n=1 Tax=Clonostachys rhizophaga TaxID=160324 RepID=A0A9N9VXQ6_9HYPO|nr:unnamed protein product [Clonostachys rhizophaga]